MRERREKRIKTRKNFFLTSLVTVILWVLIGFLIYFIDPGLPGAIAVFFLLIFLALLFTFSIIFSNTRRGVLVSLTIGLFLILRFLGVGNLLNLILMVCIALAFEIYWANK